MTQSICFIESSFIDLSAEEEKNVSYNRSEVYILKKFTLSMMIRNCFLLISVAFGTRNQNCYLWMNRTGYRLPVLVAALPLHRYSFYTQLLQLANNCLPWLPNSSRIFRHFLLFDYSGIIRMYLKNKLSPAQ